MYEVGISNQDCLEFKYLNLNTLVIIFGDFISVFYYLQDKSLS